MHKYSIRVKVIAFCVLLEFLVITTTFLITKNSFNSLEENYISGRLESDINYLNDILGNGEWNLRKDGLYLDDELIGDGTYEKANSKPFLELAEKTSTMSYVFVIDNKTKLKWVGDKKTGYQQGHFLRVAGSTTNPKGDKIIGTYIDKKVSDILDNEGVYKGEANVDGGMIYCIYKTLTDKKGNVVGAMVVGRYITELKEQVNKPIQDMQKMMTIVLITFSLIIFFMIIGFTKSIRKIASYIKKIGVGEIPDDYLVIKNVYELKDVVNGVNRIIDSLKRNTELQRQAETDELTGLYNRHFLNQNFDLILNKCIKENKSFAVEMLDIDYFKQYNDNYGHQAGDEVIASISDIIHKMAKGNENITACRYGGDEFIIIYCDFSKQELYKILKLLKKELETENIKHKYSKVSRRVTISQGLCYGKQVGNYQTTDFLKKADEALYDVKTTTKDNYKLLEIAKEKR